MQIQVSQTEVSAFNPLCMCAIKMSEASIVFEEKRIFLQIQCLLFSEQCENIKKPLHFSKSLHYESSRLSCEFLHKHNTHECHKYSEKKKTIREPVLFEQNSVKALIMHLLLLLQFWFK